MLGLDPQRDRGELRLRLGAQLQESRLPDQLKVWEALDLYASFYPNPADWRELADRLGLRPQLDTPLRQAVGRAAAAAVRSRWRWSADPEVAVLDELTTGLDPQARRDTWELIEDVRDRGVTVLLVTHFMEEAERLCDRLAVIDAGRVVALDTPAGLVADVAAEQRLRFRPSTPIDDAELLALPEVTAVTRSGHHLQVTGTGNLLHAVTSLLARRHIVAEELRLDQASLDDAFVALTGRRLEADAMTDTGGSR